MSRQDQKVEGGEAYQANGNITISHGVNAEQMAEIMIAMAKHLQVHFAEAEAKVESRLADFRKSVLEEFAKPENAESTKAFSDPDFQYTLNEAQKVFARDGSKNLLSDLVKLIAQRAKHDGSERTGKILNNAIELAGSFSKNEYAALAMNFLFTSVQIGAQTKSELLRFYSDFISPFYQDLSEVATVYEYIESQRCASINQFSSRDLITAIYHNYAAVFSKGFDHAQLQQTYPGGDLSVYTGLIATTDDGLKPLRFTVPDKSKVADALRRKGAPEKVADYAMRLHEATCPSVSEVERILKIEVIGFNRLNHVWRTTALSKMTLTAVGKVIAHSSLVSRSPFDAPLNLWIQ